MVAIVLIDFTNQHSHHWGTILYFSLHCIPRPRSSLPLDGPGMSELPKPQGLPLHHVRPRETGFGGLLRGLPGRGNRWSATWWKQMTGGKSSVEFDLTFLKKQFWHIIILSWHIAWHLRAHTFWHSTNIFWHSFWYFIWPFIYLFVVGILPGDSNF